MVAEISSTTALFCRSLFFIPDSSMDLCARTEVKRSSKNTISIPGSSFLILFTPGVSLAANGFRQSHHYFIHRFFCRVIFQKLHKLMRSHCRKTCSHDFQDVCHGYSAAFTSIIYCQESPHKISLAKLAIFFAIAKCI